jgi:hypothetical protein
MEDTMATEMEVGNHYRHHGRVTVDMENEIRLE